VLTPDFVLFNVLVRTICPQYYKQIISQKNNNISPPEIVKNVLISIVLPVFLHFYRSTFFFLHLILKFLFFLLQGIQEAFCVFFR